ncbi:hypothetical protein [Chenggangzhangella methanolivorans]|uniref:Uncharacterized protein n=1 Tax=Chenggangzhangella methanolivorans TaxID=1437009 RepID=A0A9E6RCI4_9HYPH|nr:hypothetical protein [Chenggangzhangella methanolivorans]QZN98266.1 hypothetical protein K6K41_14010 [Chenggangzhangella methanolivorans]
MLSIAFQPPASLETSNALEEMQWIDQGLALWAEGLACEGADLGEITELLERALQTLRGRRSAWAA